MVAVAEHAASATDLLVERSLVLSQALGLHAVHGDMECPVCGVGLLDTTWAQQAKSALDAENAELADLRAARLRLDNARIRAQRLVNGVPELGNNDDDELTQFDAAATALTDWRAAPANDLELADHLVAAIDPLEQAFRNLRTQADSLLAAREDLWAPLAIQLGQWVSSKQTADRVGAAGIRGEGCVRLAQGQIG